MPFFTSPVVPAGSLCDQPQPCLTIGDLVLRPWTLADVPAVVEAYRDPLIQQWHVRDMSEPEAREWVSSWSVRWRDESSASWAVTRQGTVVGRTGLNGIDLITGRAEAAYWTLPAARGQGIAVQANRVVSDWMFEQIGLHRLELTHSIGNLGSCRVAEKAGYELEGTLRQHGLHRDGWHDMHLHARLKA